jgi:hypothetical protein
MISASRAALVFTLALSTRAFADAATIPGDPLMQPEFAATRAASQPADPAETKTSLDPTQGLNSIDNRLADAAADYAGLTPYGPVSLVDPLWKSMNKSLEPIGLKLGLSWTSVFQAASNGPGYRTAAGQDVDFFGNWRFLGGKDDPTRSLLYFAVEYRGSIGTEIAPGQLGGNLGSLWGTTNGFGEQVPTFREVYWQQHLGNDAFILRVGKIDPENYYNSNYWQSDNLYFLNAAFSSFPVRAFPGQGLGFNVTIKPSPLWYISTGAQDAQGKKTRVGWDTLVEDFNLFSAFEFGLTPTIEGLGKGTYRFTGWYRDHGDTNGKPHDGGFDISFDQFVGRNYVPFFRYGWGEGNINGIEHMISTGIGWQGKLFTPTDVIGIGGAWGRPSNHALNDQYIAEVFYRMQLSRGNQLTFGYQVILDPVNDPGSDVVGVFECRWRITF